MDYKLEEVEIKDNHIKILFELLIKRKFSISHKKMPSFIEHEKFVSSHPYRYWFLISSRKKYIGSFYIQYDNSIGINIDPLNYEDAIPFILKK